MGSGNKMYDAIKEGVLNSLSDFNPDWDTLANDAYEGFIEDLKDDVRVDIFSFEEDENTDEEAVLQAYIADDGDESCIGKSALLSDLLIDLAYITSREHAVRVLSNSVAAFQAKLGD